MEARSRSVDDLLLEIDQSIAASRHTMRLALLLSIISHTGFKGALYFIFITGIIFCVLAFANKGPFLDQAHTSSLRL